jgi:hypothetical protein
MHDAFSLRGLAAGCALLFLVAPAVQAAEQLPDAPSNKICRATLTAPQQPVSKAYK